MKRFYSFFAFLVLFLLVTVGCSNGNAEYSDNSGDSKVLGFTITLPGNTARATYSQSDATSYLIQVLKEDNEVVKKTGLPGESVKLLVSEEGTYTIKVSAFDKKLNTIATGSVKKVLTFDDGLVPVVIHLTPRSKDIEIDVSIVWDNPTTTTTPVESTVKLSIKGDDADLFKLSYYDNGTQIVTTFPAEITSLITKETDLHCSAFIDSNNNNIFDNNELAVSSWVTEKPNATTEEEFDIVKSTINFSIDGDLSVYEHPMIINNIRGSGSSSRVITSIDSTSITVYGNKNWSYGYTAYLAAFEDKNNDGFFTYDTDYPISEETPVSVENGETTATIKIFETAPVILEDGKKVRMDFYSSNDSFTEEERKHYRFYKSDENSTYISFYIPTGADTDGSFITCYQCEDGKTAEWHSGDHYWHLLNSVYSDDSDMRNRVDDNYSYQFSELLQNMKDIVNYLETEKQLTVYGKELIEE